MDEFQTEIYTISNITALEDIKKIIKDQVVDPTICWQERMLLYRKVQVINERITFLGETRKKEAL
ncbi:hypothetical protein [Ammoniphilus sp. CFH 90114]|uniref:hypothetical protein n=1 Tax=Ammoniphilus sp. CFH 90114 TaxID=2493665 RepID=UPI00100F3CBF|nr:hypothetical protein [Ammoniphilus sp. CFH 90114]RXT05824.1 hypothetical protein EIZ39_17115 [Ammoniphilus sp. CFH 90114]